MMLPSLTGGGPLFENFNMEVSPKDSCNGCCMRVTNNTTVIRDRKFEEKKKFLTDNRGNLIPEGKRKVRGVSRSDAIERVDTLYSERLGEYLDRVGVDSVSTPEVKSFVYLYLGIDIAERKEAGRSLRGELLNQMKNSAVPHYIEMVYTIFKRVIKELAEEKEGKFDDLDVVNLFDSDASKLIAQHVIYTNVPHGKIFGLKEVKLLCDLYGAERERTGKERRYSLLLIERSDLEFRKKVKLVRKLVNFASWIQEGVITIDYKVLAEEDERHLKKI